jgi:positive regulator of sigma E activity
MKERILDFLKSNKFLKTLSSCLIMFNPLCGFLIIASIVLSFSKGNFYYLFLIPVLLILVFFNLKFYFYTHKKEDIKKEEIIIKEEVIQENQTIIVL